MRGEVDEAGRALLTLNVRPVAGSDSVDLVVWVDTAFDGELVIPLAAIHDMELQQSAAVQEPWPTAQRLYWKLSTVRLLGLVNGDASKSSRTKVVFHFWELACCEDVSSRLTIRPTSWN